MTTATTITIVFGGVPHRKSIMHLANHFLASGLARAPRHDESQPHSAQRVISSPIHALCPRRHSRPCPPTSAASEDRVYARSMTHCRRSSSSTLAPSQVTLQSNEQRFHPAQCLPSRTTVTTATATAHISSVCLAQVAAAAARISTVDIARERISLSRSHQECIGKYCVNTTSGCACCRFLVIPLLTLPTECAAMHLTSYAQSSCRRRRTFIPNMNTQLVNSIIDRCGKGSKRTARSPHTTRKGFQADMLHRRPTRTADPSTPLILRHSACRRISPLPSISIHRFSSRHSQIQA